MLGISLNSIYYQPIQDKKDEIIKQQIESVHQDNPSYGHRRVALELGIHTKRARRVMKKYGLKPPRRKRSSHWLTKSTYHHSYTNLLEGYQISKPNVAWCSDLTYLKYHHTKLYLAVIQDWHSREVVAAEISDHHDSQLVLTALAAANRKIKITPEIFHSDQGTEYLSQAVIDWLTTHEVKISVSAKSSPWQNGRVESFFGRFKDEMGNLNRFETIGELGAEIYAYVSYYNHRRIHTTLSMPPIKFKQKLVESVHKFSGT